MSQEGKCTVCRHETHNYSSEGRCHRRENVLFAGTRHIIIAVKVDVTGGKMYCLQARDT